MQDSTLNPSAHSTHLCARCGTPLRLKQKTFCSRSCRVAYHNQVRALPEEQRFWSKVDKTAECWIWTAGKDKDGYGKFSTRDDVSIRAHIYSWKLHYGPLPENRIVQHSCDRPDCVRPDHLYLGRSLNLIDEQRFWSYVQKTATCWLWKGAVDKDGYGKFRGKKEHLRAHRYSYLIHKGSIPEDRLVCHTCDNPSCVNPEHLWLGTSVDNNRDTVDKGRHSSGSIKYPERVRMGENHPNSRMTNNLVQEIRLRYAQGGETYLGLAREYGTTKSTIRNIILRKSWKHVE